MDKIITFSGWYDPDHRATIDYEHIKMLEATSTKELRLKVRGVLLAQLDELVEEIVTRHFQEQLVTKLGQKVSHDDYTRHLKSVPAGHGVVVRTYWRATHGAEEFASYHVPAGSTLPNGKKIREGELVWIEEYGISSAEKAEIRRFFGTTQEPKGWITVWADWQESDD